MNRGGEPSATVPAAQEAGLKARKGVVFLEKASYRRRRLTDAARLIPVVGALLWAVPMLWARAVTSTSTALLYVFSIWVVLVLGAALLSRGIGRVNWSAEAGDGSEGDREGEAQ